jgi:arylsulfatase A-like enzyme
LLLAVGGAATAQEIKPNILVIFGDDIGQTKISAVPQHHGRPRAQAARLRTGQFDKSHLGDPNEDLRCVHGFDEFLVTSPLNFGQSVTRGPLW